MLRVIGLIVLIALGDSLNPSTIAPALYVASGDRPRIGTFEFTISVFLVHLAGGLILVLGPGQLLLTLLNGIGHTTQDALEVIAGIAMLVAALGFWNKREALAHKDLPNPTPKRKSNFLLGATIIMVELPTAFPYFAAIAAILGSGGGTTRRTLELGLYNICFVLPLIAILATLLLAGERAEEILTRVREKVERRWPAVFALILLLTGLVLVGLGGVKLASS